MGLKGLPLKSAVGLASKDAGCNAWDSLITEILERGN